MNEFDEVYKRLNAEQRQAVDTLEGPVLVIAGPGTGKTQLLGARVANILQKTDTPPQNILCLTFTEGGAANMRERLTRFIGQSAYDVTIGTYHAFGRELIGRFPEYFPETRLQTPVDELGKRQILLEIVESMSYQNPLKQARHHLGDLMGTVSEIKRALLSSEDLRAIAKENLQFIAQARKPLQTIYADFGPRMSTSLPKVLPHFVEAHELLQSLVPEEPVSEKFGALAQIAAGELEQALQTAEETGKTSPLTVWKNAWLTKDADNQFIIAGGIANARIEALAEVLDQYQAALHAKGLYDFDDMIIRSTEVMATNADLKFTLQEQYLYILLDEFQDTNAAQLRLIELLTDNPVNEGRPNVLAVGDDDQAIYAFQGAQYSNMLDYHRMYRDVAVINLAHNYRSHGDVIHVAHNIATQIDARLHDNFEGMTKTLQAANPTLIDSNVERVEFLSDIAERDWIAKRIRQLIDSGVHPREIAVLAPKHKYLEPLVPYLNSLKIPVRYEKRENILDAPVTKQIIAMSRLVLALQAGNQVLASSLWVQVLSYDFWKIPTSRIWELSWKVSDNHDPAYTWSKALLEASATDPQLAIPTQLFLTAAAKAGDESCEIMLDYLIGSTKLETNDTSLPVVFSPLRDYYTSPAMQAEKPELFYETVSHLTVLRARLREHQEASEAALTLGDFVSFVNMYEEAEQQMQSTSPYNQQADAVQLMTVFKAKGLEYEHVFLPSCQDEVWGTTSRSNSNKLTLPANLVPIRHAGATDDERLRILFVAITRAKLGLHLTSATQNFTGKASKRLKYFDEQQQPDDSFAAKVLPEHAQVVVRDEGTAPTLELLELDWRARHSAALNNIDTSLHSLLSERLEKYQLSPTHLNSFVDLEYAGPTRFFFSTLLRFPEAPTLDGQFGNAIHETLEWFQHRVSENGFAPNAAETIAHFKIRIAAKKMTAQRAALEIERGEKALTAWLKKRAHIFTPSDVAEKNFRNEGVKIGDVHMAGKVDRLEIDAKTRTITVVDYKTGKSYSKWGSEPKLHKYSLQLYSYKLLIENSHSYKGYNVTAGRLEFIEPDDLGTINTLELRFNDQDLSRTKQLLQALWKHVHDLNFPDTAAYPATMTGIRQFEDDLISDII